MNVDRMNIHVVSHTHWDREWYLPAGRFRQRLVALVDELVQQPRVAETPFLLDGQAVIIEDYLALRPERRDEIARRLRDGSLEAGPWYVLADELIPSGEALVRNLLAGRRILAALGASSPPVLYCPDSFGHPATLPILAAGFGCELIILWRGLGGELWPTGDSFRWTAPDGTSALVHHLPRDGYEYGANLPAGSDAVRARWNSLGAELRERSRLGLLLVLNGADHHALQDGLDSALTTLGDVAAPDRVIRAGLRGFARELLENAGAVSVPDIEGELRSSYGYTWALQGTFASRAHLKRRNARVERALTRESEPWSVLAVCAGASSRRHLLQAAWKTLLLCHPHDTLCACSTDEVARAMEARLDDASSQARGILDDSLLDIIGHDVAAARTTPPDQWHPVVLVRNAAARERGGIADLEVLTFREHVPVGPASAHARRETPVAAQHWTLSQGRVPFQQLDRSERHHLVESPRHYPDADIVDAARVVAWLEPVAGYGIRAIGITDSTDAQQLSHPLVSVGEHWLQNDAMRVDIDASGIVSVRSLATGESITNLVGFEDVGDAGDLYTFSTVLPEVRELTFLGARLVHRGPLRGEIEGAYRIDVPAYSHREGRGASLEPHVVKVTLTLDAGAAFMRISVRGRNAALDHRLRIRIASGITDGLMHADAAFGSVLREPIIVSSEASFAETPPSTAPMARYVTISTAERGTTIFSDGLAEYESTAEGAVLVTLVRAVGELSRNDMPERPGHAGWPVSTPQAQCLANFQAQFAILLHGPRNDSTVATIERVADDVLLPLYGDTLRSALSIPPPTVGVTLEGEGLAFSSCKESDDGEWLVLRCVNLLEREVSGLWRVAAPVREARFARLDETPGELARIANGAIEFVAGRRSVVTIVTR